MSFEEANELELVKIIVYYVTRLVKSVFMWS